MSLKVDNYLKPFRGRDGDDFNTWWEKFLALATISGWDTDDKKTKHLPLFLDADAFLVFSKMEDGDKKKMDEVQKKLSAAFAVTAADAYRSFVNRKLKIDESIDAYVADLQRLLTLSGHNVAGDTDTVVIEQFVAGLPSDFARPLRMAFAGKTIKISECVEQVRALRATASACAPAPVAAAATNKAGKSGGATCYHCGQPGHVRRNCPKRAGRDSGEKQEATKEKRKLTCFFCDKPGHVKADCPERKAWQQKQSGAHGVVSAACLTTVAAPGDLPRIFVDVGAAETADCASWNRFRAVVDTGSTHTIVSKDVVSAMDVRLCTDQPSSLVALDGEPVALVGTIDLQLRRLDGPVTLPLTETRALVVESLGSALSASVLIGNDVVASHGGLQLRYDQDHTLTSVTFGPDPVVATALADDLSHPSPHVTVSQDGGDIVLQADDGEVRWLTKEAKWQIRWKWIDGQEPGAPVGPAIGEYSRSTLTDEEEEQFCQEIQHWIDEEWLVPHNQEVHGSPAAVLPLIAHVQAHKETTPVRPCLDYRFLNKCLSSQPGQDSPDCGDTIRKWRCAGGARGFSILDVRKAYLQVHVHPELLRYQTVIWGGKRYVMTRMGFGLNVAPKFMDIVIRWVTRGLPNVDNYIDDVRTPTDSAELVAKRMREYGLPTKPAEPMSSARVLGLQLQDGEDDCVQWTRRAGVDLKLPRPATKRSLFSWCGRLTSHVPVCGWLRLATSYLKRLAGSSTPWEQPLSDTVLNFCDEVEAKLDQDGDPATGPWHPSEEQLGSDTEFVVYTDASDIGLGVVLQVDGRVLEDAAWLRKSNDRKHINVAELDAAIKGLAMAVSWKATRVQLVTDSKSVAKWLDDTIRNVCRVKTKGLNEVLIQRRLQIVSDIVTAPGLSVSVKWVPSNQNAADVLSRVPTRWVTYAKSLTEDTEDLPVSAAASATIGLTPAVSLEQIVSAQVRDSNMQLLAAAIRDGRTLPDAYRKVSSQLTLEDDIVFRSVKLPVEGLVKVPVVPEGLVPAVLEAAHCNSGHSSWDTMYAMIRSCCYFPNIASMCQEYVVNCSQCQAANPCGAARASPTRPDVPGRPWSEVILDTLELGTDCSGEYHCVLVAIDAFTPPQVG